MIPLFTLGAAAPRGSEIAPPSGNTYSQVRIRISANDGDPWQQITEMEVAAATGGANLCVGGTPSASAADASYPASKAFDGVKNANVESWAAQVAAPQWLRYEFAEPAAIGEVRLWGPQPSSLYDRGPKNFTIEGSNDGSTWTILYAANNQIYSTDYEQKTYSIPDFVEPSHGAHRYWRLYITSEQTGGSNYKGVTELEFLDIHGNYLLAGATGSQRQAGASASSTINSSNDPDHAFEGGTSNSGWLSVVAATPQWIQFDFNQLAGPVEVQAVRIMASWNQLTATPKDFEIQYSDDGSTWTTAKSFTGETNWKVKEVRTFVL